MPLLTTKTLTPGGWFYEQKDAAGAPFKKFHTHGPFDDFCRSILAVRQGNGLPGADLATVMADVDRYQCNRLGNDPRYCGQGSGPVTRADATFFSPGTPGCSTCGGTKS